MIKQEEIFRLFKEDLPPTMASKLMPLSEILTGLTIYEWLKLELAIDEIVKYQMRPKYRKKAKK